MRILACFALFCAFSTHVYAAPIVAGSGTVDFGSTVPAFMDTAAGGNISYAVTNSSGASSNGISLFNSPGGATSEALSFFVQNSSGASPITSYAVSIDANPIGATITGVTLGATTASQGFSATFNAFSVSVFGGSAPTGSAPSDFTVTFAVPAAGFGQAFSLKMTTNPEPTSLCLMAIGMSFVGGGSFWRRRKKQSLEQTAATVA